MKPERVFWVTVIVILTIVGGGGGAAYFGDRLSSFNPGASHSAARKVELVDGKVDTSAPFEESKIPVKSTLALRAEPQDPFSDDIYGSLPKEFRRYVVLRRKALLTQEEVNLYENELLDSALLRKVEEILTKTATQKSVPTWREKNQRLAAIDYLRTALERSGPGNRRDIQQLLNEIVTFGKPFSAETPLSLRKSLTGDRIEIFQLIRRFFPEEFRSLQSRISGDPWSERIYRWVEKEKVRS